MSLTPLPLSWITQAADRAALAELLAPNVGPRSLFVETTDPRRVGTRVQVKVWLKTDVLALDFVGTVSWVFPSEAVPVGHEAGMGLFIDSGSPDSMAFLEELRDAGGRVLRAPGVGMPLLDVPEHRIKAFRRADADRSEPSTIEFKIHEALDSTVESAALQSAADAEEFNHDEGHTEADRLSLIGLAADAEKATGIHENSREGMPHFEARMLSIIDDAAFQSPVFESEEQKIPDIDWEEKTGVDDQSLATLEEGAGEGNAVAASLSKAMFSKEALSEEILIERRVVTRHGAGRELPSPTEWPAPLPKPVELTGAAYTCSAARDEDASLSNIDVVSWPAKGTQRISPYATFAVPDENASADAPSMPAPSLSNSDAAGSRPSSAPRRTSDEKESAPEANKLAAPDAFDEIEDSVEGSKEVSQAVKVALGSGEDEGEAPKENPSPTIRPAASIAGPLAKRKTDDVPPFKATAAPIGEESAQKRSTDPGSNRRKKRPPSSAIVNRTLASLWCQWEEGAIELIAKGATLPEFERQSIQPSGDIARVVLRTSGAQGPVVGRVEWDNQARTVGPALLSVQVNLDRAVHVEVVDARGAGWAWDFPAQASAEDLPERKRTEADEITEVTRQSKRSQTGQASKSSDGILSRMKRHFREVTDFK